MRANELQCIETVGRPLTFGGVLRSGAVPKPCARPKMVKRRVSGGGVQDNRSMQPRIRKAHLLITHVLDSCVKLLAVLHISSAGSIRRPHLCRVGIERTCINGMQRTIDYPITKQPSQQNPHASASHQNTRVSYGHNLSFVSC